MGCNICASAGTGWRRTAAARAVAVPGQARRATVGRAMDSVGQGGKDGEERNSMSSKDAHLNRPCRSKQVETNDIHAPIRYDFPPEHGPGPRAFAAGKREAHREGECAQGRSWCRHLGHGTSSVMPVDRVRSTCA